LKDQSVWNGNIFFRFFKEELLRVSESGEVRNNILRAIRDVEKDILSTLNKQKEQMERENLNMQKAIAIIEKKRSQEQWPRCNKHKLKIDVFQSVVWIVKSVDFWWKRFFRK